MRSSKYNLTNVRKLYHACIFFKCKNRRKIRHHLQKFYVWELWMALKGV
jgi:hypothetical protein